MSELKLSMGTMTFKGAEQLQACLDVLKSVGIVEIDSGEVYGTSESDLGEVNAAEQGFIVSTKNGGGYKPPGYLQKKIKQSTEISLTKLKLRQLDILHIHAPDRTSKPADWAHEIDDLYKAGKFRRFGISNFTAEETRELHAYCKANSLVLPTVYQGNYNAVARHIERDLFPLLRELGITFYAYSAIAGGFLAKSRKALEEGTEAGRFAVDAKATSSKLYRAMYLQPSLLEGLGKWTELARIQGVPPAELAYRWTYYHSALDTEKGDHVVLGASRLDQITQTVEGLKRGPLKPEVVKGIDEIWGIVKDEAIVDDFEPYQKLVKDRQRV